MSAYSETVNVIMKSRVRESRTHGSVRGWHREVPVYSTLMGYFTREEDMLSMVFLKGYQWPFDVNKIFGGSSVIDLLAYQETILKGRRVYFDFTRNPGGKEVPFEKLSQEAYDYLKQAGALSGTPIERLRQMNEPAISYYQDYQVDLCHEKLEVAVCV